MSEPMTLTAQSALLSGSPTSRSLEELRLLGCKEDKTLLEKGLRGRVACKGKFTNQQSLGLWATEAGRNTSSYGREICSQIKSFRRN